MELTDKVKDIVNDIKVINHVYLLNNLKDNWLLKYIDKKSDYDEFNPNQLKSIYKNCSNRKMQHKAKDYYVTEDTSFMIHWLNNT